MHGGFNAVASLCRTSQRSSYAAGSGQQHRLAAIECDAMIGKRVRHTISLKSQSNAFKGHPSSFEGGANAGKQQPSGNIGIAEQGRGGTA
jgi:hypothetical protein